MLGGTGTRARSLPALTHQPTVRIALSVLTGRPAGHIDRPIAEVEDDRQALAPVALTDEHQAVDPVERTTDQPGQPGTVPGQEAIHRGHRIRRVPGDPPHRKPPPARTMLRVIYELRQYTLHPGQRDVLIDLFDRELVEPQEQVGMLVHGQFRTAADPDRFVWLRGFADLPARDAGLEAFYHGPVWRVHRRAANATMATFDDVRLLRPVDDQAGLPVPASRPDVGATALPSSRFTATLYHFAKPVTAEFQTFFADRVAPLLSATGATVIARLETEYAENNFPSLPVRTGEHVFVWLARFDDADQLAAHTRRLAGSDAWRDEVEPDLLSRLSAPPQTLVLSPTARSALR